jgi:superfamily II RNA helicase
MGNKKERREEEEWRKKGASVDVSYAAPQAHKIVNVALHRMYSPGIVFIFSQGRKDLYHVED